MTRWRLSHSDHQCSSREIQTRGTCQLRGETSSQFRWPDETGWWFAATAFPGTGCDRHTTTTTASANTNPSSKFKNKYERYNWTRKAPACLLTLLRHYGKPRLCINIHQYAPPIGCSVTHRAATSLAAAGLCGVSEGPEGSMSSFKSIT